MINADWLPMLVNRLRLPASRLIGAVIIGLFLVSHHVEPEGGWLDFLMENTGFILIAGAAFGRLWCLMYISGYKNRELLTVGPYSVVRHPLYVFNLMGAVGLGLATEELTVLIAVLALFLGVYPFVMVAEERRLTAKHGEAYRAYAARTPRFVPNLALLREPGQYTVNARQFRRAFVDAMWFVWLFGLLEAIETLHEMGLIPTLLTLP